MIKRLKKGWQTLLGNKQIIGQPTIILGVPRSGTTLLRVLLDSHSQIAAPPETPWILGSYHPETSFRTLAETLSNSFTGPVKNLKGITEEVILENTRQFIQNILGDYLKANQKSVIVLKTPDDIYYLDFLLKLFPFAKYIHLYRDGRDVAYSTISKKKIFFGETFQKEYGTINFYNSVKRWAEWEQKIRNTFTSASPYAYHTLTYESLIMDPTKHLNQICNFIGLPFEQQMLNYQQFSHEYPNYEAGSFDVQAKKTIQAGNFGKWRGRITEEELTVVYQDFGDFFLKIGYSINE